MRRKKKISNKQTVVISHTDGVSAEEIANKSRRLTRTAEHAHACSVDCKQGTKPKDECDDSGVTVPQHIRTHGRPRHCQKNSGTITRGRERLDSNTFNHCITHIWGSVPEEYVHSFAYLDSMWFYLYACGNNIVVDWIKNNDICDDICTKKYTFVPIVMWSHWSLLIFCHLGKRLYAKNNAPCMVLLDSLQSSGGPSQLEPIVRRFLFEIYKSEGRQWTMEQVNKIPLLVPKVPQQKSGNECGYYALYYLNRFIESSPEYFNASDGYPYFMKEDWFTPEDVESFCQRLDSLPPPKALHYSSDCSDSDHSIEYLGSKKGGMKSFNG